MPKSTSIPTLPTTGKAWRNSVEQALLYCILLFAFIAFSSLSAYWVAAPYDGWRIYELFILIAFAGYLICSKNSQASLFTPKTNKIISLILILIAGLVIYSSYYARYSQRAIADAALLFLLVNGIYTQAILLRKYPSVAPTVAAWLAVLPMLTLIFLPIAIYDILHGRPGAWTQSFTNIRMLDDALLPCLFLLWQRPAWLSYKKEKNKLFNNILNIVIYSISIIYLLSFWLHGARAGIASIVVALLLLFTFRKNQERKLKIPIATIVISGALFFLLNLLQVTNGTGSAITRTGSSGRIDLWQKSIMLWQQQPILGMGGNNFAFKDPFFLVTHPHNIFFQLLSEWGVAGILALLLPLPLAIVIIHKRKILPPFVLAAIIAVGFNAMFSGALIYPVSQLLALWPLAWIISLLPISSDNNSSHNSNLLKPPYIPILHTFKILAAIAVVAMLAIHGRDMLCNNCMSADWEGAPRFWDSGRALHLIPYDETKIGKTPDQL